MPQKKAQKTAQQIEQKKLEALPDLLDEVRSQHDQLSKRLRQVAEFVLSSPSDVAFGTVATLSQQAQVHPSTWVRFANHFGFSGFREMQKLFQTSLVQEPSNYQERIRHIQQSNNTLSAAGILAEFAQENAMALDRLTTDLSANELDMAVDVLAKAESVFVIGARRSFAVANYLAYALRHVGRKTHLIDGAGGMYEEQADNLQTGDALIAMSFYPYASETQTVAMAAIEKQLPLIVITDSPVSPLAKIASVNFVVKEAELHQFRSLSSSMVLAQSLAMALAYKLENE